MKPVPPMPTTSLLPTMTPVRLLKAHTHAGCSYPPGERLQVSAAVCEWLIANGVAQEVAQADPQVQVRPSRTDVPLLSLKPQPLKDPTP